MLPNTSISLILSLPFSTVAILHYPGISASPPMTITPPRSLIRLRKFTKNIRKIFHYGITMSSRILLVCLPPPHFLESKQYPVSFVTIIFSPIICLQFIPSFRGKKGKEGQESKKKKGRKRERERNWQKKKERRKGGRQGERKEEISLTPQSHNFYNLTL